MIRYHLYPQNLSDLSKYSSGTKIADITLPEGFGALVVKERCKCYDLLFLWLPNKGHSKHLLCSKNVVNLNNEEFEIYIQETFNHLMSS